MSDSLTLHMPPPKKRLPCPWRGLRWLMALALITLVAAGAWMYTGRTEVRGTVEGHYLPIAPLMTARVAEVLATEGQMVKSGQVLLRLDGGAYARQEADARALVRGARMPTLEETAERVAAAQAAEEYSVRRVALARHEEEAQRQLLEHRAHEHARAQLRMRDLDARGGPVTAKARQEAQQAESQARRHWEQARSTHESASRTRAVVEGELHRVRAEMDRARQGRGPVPVAAALPPSAPSASFGTGDPTLITAPQSGKLLGRLPQPGHMLARGEAVLHLIPGNNAALWVTAEVPPSAAKALRVGQWSLIRPQGQSTALMAVVDDIQPLADPNAPVALRLRLEDEKAAALSAQITGNPATVIVWSNSLPGLQHMLPFLSPLLAL